MNSMIGSLIKYLLIWGPCFGNSLYAQVVIHVESSEDHTSLSYATVVNYSKHSLLFADEQGNLSANFQNGDSIGISYVGYDDLDTRFDSTNMQPYSLSSKKQLMQSVRVQSCKKWKNVDYSNLTGDPSARAFGGVSWDKRAMNAKIAVMLKPPGKPGRLNAFSIWLKKNIAAPKISVRAPIKFSFYDIDVDSLPGELISNRQVIYLPKKEGKQTIRLDSMHLKIPAKGMYLCIEYVMNEKYEWPVRYIDTSKGIDTTIMGYGASLDGIFATDFVVAFYNYYEDSWHFPGNNDRSVLHRIHGSIKCEAEIEYCVEGIGEEQ